MTSYIFTNYSVYGKINGKHAINNKNRIVEKFSSKSIAWVFIDLMYDFRRTLYTFIFFKICHLFCNIIVTETLTISGLKWVRVNVPQYRIPGEIATLQCHYDLGNASLYAVKWYKDHEEFYRFVPKAKPQANSYEVEGVYVDVSI